jgi:hypothetical protein
MFQLLALSRLQEGDAAPAPELHRENMRGGIPAPPASYIPPTGSSYMTWPNVYMNLKNIDYCVDQFDQITNRVKCIKAFTGGPFLN